MSTPSTPAPRTPWLIIFAAALPAALHALYFLGRLHPDEVFQSLEVAMNKTYGFGQLPWEFVNRPGEAPWGIRNWAVPTLFSWIFRLGDALGLSTPMARRTLVEVPQLLLHAAMLGAVYRLAVRRISRGQAIAVVWLVALYPPVLWFAGRTMSESFSTAFLVWGLERLDHREGRWHVALLGGLLLGLAQITRYGSVAAIVPAMLWLLAQRRWATFGLTTLGGLIAAGFLGWLDLVTWGSWFHSMIDYVRFNVISGQAAAQFGAQPWWQYAARLIIAPWALIGLLLTLREGRWRRPAIVAVLVGVGLAALAASLGPRVPEWVSPGLGLLTVAALAVLLLVRDAERPTLLLASAIGYVLVLSATAHKEERFLYPALVMLTVAGSVPFVAWAVRTLNYALPVAAVIGTAFFFLVPTPFDPQRPEQFQLVAHDAPQTTGLVIMNEGMWGSPAFFYLGKNIPWCPCDFPRDGCFQFAARDARFNRGLYWSTGDANRDGSSEAAFTAAGFRVKERRGRAVWFER